MPPRAMSRFARQQQQQKQPGLLWTLHGHSTSAFLLFAVFFVGGGPHLPFLQSSSSSAAAPGNGFVVSAAAAAAVDTAATATIDTTTRKQPDEEEDALLALQQYVGGGGRPRGFERKLREIEIMEESEEDEWTVDSDLDNSAYSSALPSVFLEGCTIPAKVTSVEVKHGKPETGNIAEHAIDGNPLTWWSRKGRRRWMKIEFEGGARHSVKVGGVAISFLRGDRRVSFFDMTLLDADDEVVAKREGLESGGQTKDFETFDFDEPAKGSKILLDLKGTTAGIWNGIVEVSICLHRTATPAPVPAEVPPATVSGWTYVGCFMDDSTGRTRYLGDKRLVSADMTPHTCADFCDGYTYMGLQYAKDCNCGDTYYTSDRAAVRSDKCKMPCIGDESSVCGGPWMNSIYQIEDMTGEEEEEDDVDTSVEDDGVPRRKFTIHNNCAEQIRLGATGGYVQRVDNLGSCPEGSTLDQAVGACFWALPLPEDEKTYDIAPGGSVEVILDNPAINGVRWSGNLWASTGCQAKVGCETASCLRNRGYPDGFCPPSTGPTGPVTKAEFTLVDTGVDYYDVTVIDGVNLPLEMRPDPRSEPLERAEDPYWCSNPGGVSSMSKELEGCSWRFDATKIEGFTDYDMSSFLRWVQNNGLFIDCEVNSDCDDYEDEGIDLKCGTLFGQDTLNGGVTEEIFARKCGSNLGWYTPGAICASSHSKPLGYFPNSFPFMCDVQTDQVVGDNSTQADLYQCIGKIYGQSGYSRAAEETACGCPDWIKEGINAPTRSTCHAENPYWHSLSLPWLKYLKRACPTAYTFPYDDHTATFVCRNEDEKIKDAGKNSMSYIIEFCPEDSQARLLERD